jgi:subtilisin-like proprotein convertase family protein
VSTNEGGGDDDIFNGTLFDDQSLNSVSTYPYVDGVAAPDLRPELSFNTTFRGENPNGVWTLSIDDVAGGDVGFLNSWSLSITDGAILSVPPTLGAPVNYSTGPIAVPIFDLTTSTVPLVISGGATSIVKVQAYVEITHTWNSDLVIQLQSPLGTTQDLSFRRGGSFDDVFNGTLFRADSPNPIASYSFSDGVAAPDLRPDGDLNTFAGENANGTWNLIVTDLANGDIGSINRFDLNVIECGPGSTPYCSGKINSLGCLPAIGSTGYSSASLGSGFVVSGSNLRNNKPTMLVYTDAGRAATPFYGGILCVQGPVHRGPSVSSGGTAAPVQDCTGAYSLDMNAFATGSLGGNPAAFLLVPGTVVDSQIWARDPGFPVPNNASLTGGLEWTVGL